MPSTLHHEYNVTHNTANGDDFLISEIEKYTLFVGHDSIFCTKLLLDFIHINMQKNMIGIEM